MVIVINVGVRYQLSDKEICDICNKERKDGCSGKLFCTCFDNGEYP